jgi:hypothetical protein
MRMATHPSVMPAAADSHFGAATQATFAAIARFAPAQTTARIAIWAPWRTRSPKGV